MRISLVLILFFICYYCYSQKTFTRWISTPEDEEVFRIKEHNDSSYIIITRVGEEGLNTLEVFINKRNIIYLMGSEGTFTDSLTLDTLENHEVLVNNIVLSDENGIMLSCNALNKETMDQQLCLIWLDEDMEIVDYSFHGSSEIVENVSDHTINHENNLVFVGSTSNELLDGHCFLWKMDVNGDEIEFSIDSTYTPATPTIIEMPGNLNYHVDDWSGVVIYNQKFEQDTILILENNNVFFGLPQRHLLIDDFHYLKIGLYFQSINPPASPYDMAFILLNEQYKIQATYIFGSVDSTDYPNSIHFKTIDNIFLGGVKNYETSPPDDSWVSLYKTNLAGDTIFSRFYGGYGLYGGVQVIATTDGGCFIAANLRDFHNWIPTEPLRSDVLFIKVDENGLLISIPPDIPFEQTDIIVYPNPGLDLIKVESSLKNLRIELFDTNGSLVLDKNFNFSIQLNTGHLPPGNYIYRIAQKEKLFKSGIWVKR